MSVPTLAEAWILYSQCPPLPDGRIRRIECARRLILPLTGQWPDELIDAPLDLPEALSQTPQRQITPDNTLNALSGDPGPEKRYIAPRLRTLEDIHAMCERNRRTAQKDF